jgi:hypothetical protein
MINELERMWKEVVMAKFKVQLWNLRKTTEIFRIFSLQAKI